MASIRRLEGKTGPSFKITVTTGTNSEGKQIRHYMTWRPDRPMTERQMEKGAQKAAYEFERQVGFGFCLDNRQTFDAYTAYVLATKTQHGLAPTTLENYKNRLQRASPYIGHLKMTDIRPQHLNLLYKSLSTEKMGATRMKPTPHLLELVHAFPKQHLVKSAHLNTQTVGKLWAGQPVLLSTAQRVARYWSRDLNELFTPAPSTKTCTPEYIRSVHACLSTIFAQAEKEMLIQYNPAQKASPPKSYESRNTYLEPDQVTLVLSALEDEPLKWRALVHILIVTGCRRGEVLSLKWSNLDVEKRRIFLNSGVTYCKAQGVADGPTKTRTTRYVTLPRETVALLAQYRACQQALRSAAGDAWQDNDLIFTTDTGGLMSPTSVNAWLGRFCRRHGLPHIHPHAFRHTAASIMIANGVDIVTVSKMLGHKRPSMTTDVYSHMIAQAQQNATESIAQVLLRAAPLSSAAHTK